jgi:hypothetical protein
MLNSLSVFQNINDTLTLNTIHEHLERSIQFSPEISFDDILRSKFINSVSAFDKFMHDFIRSGMIEIFKNIRATTPKYLSEPITLSMYTQLINATTPPAEIIFGQFILDKHKMLSFQSPDKVADGLSFIWDEKQKWLKISVHMGLSEDVVKKTLSLITSRRNGMVHEADIDPITHQKYPITKEECNDVTNFLLSTGNSIAHLVT